MHFNIVKPSPELAPYISHYWYTSFDYSWYKGSEMITADRVLPSGCIFIIFHRGDHTLMNFTAGEACPDTSICGQMTHPVDAGPVDDTEMFTVVFQPYAAKVFLQFPLNKILNQEIDVYDTEDRKLIDLANRVRYAEKMEDCVLLVEDFMRRRLAEYQGYNMKRTATVLNAIRRNICLELEEQADIACCCPKQLVRIFNDEVGASPKWMVRIMRIQQVLYWARQQNYSLAQIAYMTGFCDQSHFNKEFKLFTGCSPTDYIARYKLEQSLYSDYYNHMLEFKENKKEE